MKNGQPHSGCPQKLLYFSQVSVISSAAMLVLAAGMLSAVMTAFMMMAAHGIRIINKLPCKKCRNIGIRISGSSRIKRNPNLCQRRSGASADAAADQGIHIPLLQEACQRAMSAADCAYYLGIRYFPVFHIIDFKILTMPEMLEYLSVFIGYCNFRDEYASVIFYANCSLLLFMAYVNNSPNLINGIYRQLTYYNCSY